MWHGDEASWKDDLDLQLPARGERHAERPLTDAERVIQRLEKIDSRVDVLAKDISQLLDDKSEAKPTTSPGDFLARIQQLDDDFQQAIVKDFKRESIIDLGESIRQKLRTAYAVLRNALERRKVINQTRHSANQPIYQSGAISPVCLRS